MSNHLVKVKRRVECFISVPTVECVAFLDRVGRFCYFVTVFHRLRGHVCSLKCHGINVFGPLGIQRYVVGNHFVKVKRCVECFVSVPTAKSIIFLDGIGRLSCLVTMLDVLSRDIIAAIDDKRHIILVDDPLCIQRHIGCYGSFKIVFCYILCIDIPTAESVSFLCRFGRHCCLGTDFHSLTIDSLRAVYIETYRRHLVHSDVCYKRIVLFVLFTILPISSKCRCKFAAFFKYRIRTSMRRLAECGIDFHILIVVELHIRRTSVWGRIIEVIGADNNAVCARVYVKHKLKRIPIDIETTRLIVAERLPTVGSFVVLVHSTVVVTRIVRIQSVAKHHFAVACATDIEKVLQC